MKEKPSLAEKVATTVVLDFLLLTAFALNFGQRKAIRDRDGNKCQFPVRGHRCNGKEQLHVNHIFPQKYMKDLGVDPDYPENLITICQASHTGDPSNGHYIEPVHPDIRDARRNYHNDKGSIDQAIEEQKRRQSAREIWWNTEYDRVFQVIATRNTQKMDKKHGRSNWWDKLKNED